MLARSMDALTQDETPGDAALPMTTSRSPMTHAPRRVLRAGRAGRAGVVMVEYAFLLAFFGVPVMLGTAAAGIHLIQAYGDIRNDMLGKGP